MYIYIYIYLFWQALLNKNPKMTDYTMVHNFLGAMENPFRSHKLWRDGDENDMLEVVDALEAYILSQDQVTWIYMWMCIKIYI